MFPVKIAGIGCYLPGRVITNAEIEAHCDIGSDWIESLLGVRERRWVNSCETNASMGAVAAREAVADAGLTLNDLDLIINASGTQQQFVPDGAALLQLELGLGTTGIPCYSVHATCLSFLVALQDASLRIVQGLNRAVLIVSSEITSCLVNYRQPETAALFGDAAAAVVLVPSYSKENSRIEQTHFETYGIGAHLTEIRGGTYRHPSHCEATPEDFLFQMNGTEVLKLARHYVPGFLEHLKPGLSHGLGTIKWVVPHQASLQGLRTLRVFRWNDEQVLRTLAIMGNCVAASIPVTLYKGVRAGHIERGDEVLLVGTGAGLSIGGVILTY